MRVAKVTQQEIDRLRNILFDLQNLRELLCYNELEDLSFEDFETLKGLDNTYPRGVLYSICRQISETYFEKILFNLTTLLDNCADEESDYLDFNKDIKRGFELLELEKQGKLKITE